MIKNKLKAIKEWFISKRIHFIAFFSTLLLLAICWFMAFKWLEAQILQIQEPNTEIHIVKTVKADNSQKLTK